MEHSKPIQPKVKAATTASAASGVGGGVAVAFIYHEITGHMMDPMVAVVFAGVLGSIGAWLGGYLKKD